MQLTARENLLCANASDSIFLYLGISTTVAKEACTHTYTHTYDCWVEEAESKKNRVVNEGLMNEKLWEAAFAFNVN